MPDGSEHALEAEQIFNLLGRASLDYVDADLGMISDSLDQVRTGDLFGIPTLVFSPGLSVALRFDITVSETKEIIFGLIKKERSEQLAQLKIDMNVAPVHSEVAAVPAEMEVLGTWPEFVESASHNELVIRLSGGGRLALLPHPSGEIRDSMVLWPSGERERFDRLSPGLVAEMYLTLADWLRGRRFVPPALLRTKTGGVLDDLIGHLVSGSRQLIEETAVYLRPAAANAPAAKPHGPKTLRTETGERIVARRHRLSPVLGEEHLSYGFAQLGGRMNVLLDQDGELATEPFQEGAQRYDIQASVKRQGGADQLVFTLWIPDFLVSGPLHSGILGSLSLRKPVGKLREELEDHLPRDRMPSIAQLRAFLANSRQRNRAIIVRTRRGQSGTDRDLFLLNGRMANQNAQLMFSADLEFKNRGSTSAELQVDDVDNIRLSASKFGDGGWEEHEAIKQEPLRYLHRFLLTQHRWRLRFD